MDYVKCSNECMGFETHMKTSEDIQLNIRSLGFMREIHLEILIWELSTDG